MSDNWRAANAAKATEAKMQATDERLAARLAGRGWTVLRSGVVMNGFPAPVMATSPVHFKDYCRECCDAGVAAGALNAPHARTEGRHGWRFSYRCASGHTWTCSMSFDRARCYYSDCPCDYCTGRRAEAMEAHWPPLAPANWTGRA